MDNRNFDILVLGSSGGPLEGHNSTILLKPHKITFKDIITKNLNSHLIAIDAGAGLGKLAEIISDEKHGFENRVSNSVLNLYNDSISLSDANQSRLPTSSSLGLGALTQSPIELAYSLLELTRIQLITHPHLDHVASLSINSPGFGNNSGKTIYGLKQTIESLKANIFNNSVWPDLAGDHNGNFFEMKQLVHMEKVLFPPNYTITPFEINHGCTPLSHYHSTAFLIEHNSKQILIFGDVEADSDSMDDSTSNLKIWEHTIRLIIQKTLNTIVIECSTPNLPIDSPSYGHLSPTPLIEELLVLQRLLKKELIASGIKDERLQQPLKGVNILITHVKDRRDPVDPRKVIIKQLNELNEKHTLGCNFTILLAGQIYTVS